MLIIRDGYTMLIIHAVNTYIVLLKVCVHRRILTQSDSHYHCSAVSVNTMPYNQQLRHCVAA